MYNMQDKQSKHILVSAGGWREEEYWEVRLSVPILEAGLG